MSLSVRFQDIAGGSHAASVVQAKVGSAQNRAHQYWIDWARSFGAIAVVTIHVVSYGLYLQLAGVGRYATYNSLLFLLTRWAVPAFFMITGWLMLEPGREVGVARSLRAVCRFGAALLVFALPLALMRSVVENCLDMDSILTGVELFLAGESWPHLWYLYALLGLWFLMPVFSAFARSAGRSAWQYVLVALWFATTVVPFMNSFGVRLYPFIPVDGSAAGTSLLYVLLGGYVRRWLPSSRVAMRLALSSVLIVLVCIWVFSFSGLSAEPFWAPTSPIVPLWSVAVFTGFARCARFKEPPLDG